MINLCYDCLEYDRESNICRFYGEEAGESVVSCYAKIPMNTEDTSALSCLLALRTVYSYLCEEEAASGGTYWIDKKDYHFSVNTGYFFDGLLEMEDYLIDRLRTPVVKENEE